METILTQAVILFLANSFFPTLAYMYFSLAYWGYSLKTYAVRGGAAVFVFALYTDITVQFLPPYVQVFNALAALLIMAMLLYRKISLREKVKVSLTTWFIALCAELTFGGLPLLFATKETIFTNPFLLSLFMWPPGILFGHAALDLHRRRKAPGKELLAFLSARKNKESLQIAIFLLLQLLLLALVFVISFDPQTLARPSVTILSFAACILNVIIVIYAIRLIGKTRDEAVRKTQQLYIEDVNNMFTTIRGQRHDFLNHVQVMQSFLKLKKYDDLERYCGELLGRISDVNELVRINHPALSALIQAKLVTAEENKIRFAYSFSGMEKLSLGVRSVDIVKIMGNLIDNAIEETMSLPPEERWVEASGWVEGDDLCLSTRNPGREITPEETSNLFKSGFSTKKEDGHSGIGLSVVKERVEYYRGVIQVESSKLKGTVFSIRIPLKSGYSYKKEM